MNMLVPFIYDSTGGWKAPDDRPEEWYWLYYGNDIDRDTQFDFDSINQTLFLNSVTPQEREIPIYQVYFKLP